MATNPKSLLERGWNLKELNSSVKTGKKLPDGKDEHTKITFAYPLPDEKLSTVECKKVMGEDWVNKVVFTALKVAIFERTRPECERLLLQGKTPIAVSNLIATFVKELDLTAPIQRTPKVITTEQAIAKLQSDIKLVSKPEDKEALKIQITELLKSL